MRRFFAQRKHALLLLLGAVLLCVASQVCVFTGYTNFVRLSQRTTTSVAIGTTPPPIVTSATKQQASLNKQGDRKSLPYTSGNPQVPHQLARLNKPPRAMAVQYWQIRLMSHTFAASSSGAATMQAHLAYGTSPPRQSCTISTVL